jgi:formylglycine-generating enzyme required for sulfatase activity
MPPSVAQVPKTLQTHANTIGMQLVALPGGEFRMGSENFEDTNPVHTVRLSSFSIGMHEVTNRQYEHFRKRPRPDESRNDDQPVTRIGWQDAVDFCKWLSNKEKKRYRLPTEAEWEYAARGGLKNRDYPWGNESPDGRAALKLPTTKPVGSYKPNAFGLYDMAGNVREWCSDWYSPTYYASSPIVNPKGPTTGEFKVCRGSFYTLFEGHVWLRTPYPPNGQGDVQQPNNIWEGDGNGFRVVLEVDERSTALVSQKQD